MPSSTAPNVPELIGGPKKNGGPRVRLNTGAEMPLVGLGTYLIMDPIIMDKAVEAALRAGYRHFDTASVYYNEAQLGTALQQNLSRFGLKREDIFITTKLHPRTENMRSVDERVEHSLLALKTDYIDLLLVHYPCQRSLRDDCSAKPDDPKNPERRKNTWLALEKIPQSKIRSIGVSNFEIRHLEEMKAYANKWPAVNQCEYHPHFTRSELRDYCTKEGIFFEAFSSIGQHATELINEPLVNQLAEKYDVTTEVLLLAFATSQGIGVIPKSQNPSRIELNYNCLDVQLDVTEIAELLKLNRDKFYVSTCQPWNVL